MKVTMTAGELIDKGLWDKACEMLGLNVWAVNEGLMTSDTGIDFTEEQARGIGLLPSCLSLGYDHDDASHFDGNP